MKLTKGMIAWQVMSTTGFATGIYLAYKAKKGFWGYAGYAIGLSAIGWVIGRTAKMAIDGNTDAVEPTKEEVKETVLAETPIVPVK